MKINLEDLRGEYKFDVKINKSLPKPVTCTDVTKTSDGWIFPENVEIYNRNNVYLYAFGINHIWRTADMENWELVK